MTYPLLDLMSELTQEFGFSEELSEAFMRLSDHVKLEAMPAHEQGELVVAFAQLLRDGYTKKIRDAQARGDTSIAPYASYAVEVIDELTSRGGAYAR